MRSIEEVRAEFEDEEGNLQLEQSAAFREALMKELAASQIALSQVTGGENVALLEQWVVRTFAFITDQLFEVLTEIRQLDYAVARSVMGEAYEGPEPAGIMQEIESERAAMHQAIGLARVAGLYELVRSKTEKKIEVVK